MTNRTKNSLAALGILAALIAVRVWFGLGSQPQLKSDEEVFKTVDALFTAVTAHDETRLAACEKRLESFKTAGQLSAAAAKRLGGVIATARAGQWDTAARRLYDFMQGQRREGLAASPVQARSAASQRLVR